MKIAVTGATGFIGRHVLDALAREARVEAIAVSRRPARDDAWPAGVRHATLDIASPLDDAWDRMGRPDVLVHLAWSGLPQYRSRHHFESELGRQYAFLRSLVRAGLPALLCAGTCFEYGDRSGELDEAMPADPGNAYAFAKDALRRELAFLREEHPFRFTWARLFYMYGPGQPAGSLYGQYRLAQERGDKVFPMSPGDQLRDYLPVTEVAGLLTRLALRSPDAGIVNVCSGRKIAVRDIVARWMESDGRPMELALGRLGYAPHEPMQFWGSTAKLHALLEMA